MPRRKRSTPERRIRLNEDQLDQFSKTPASPLHRRNGFGRLEPGSRAFKTALRVWEREGPDLVVRWVRRTYPIPVHDDESGPGSRPAFYWMTKDASWVPALPFYGPELLDRLNAWLPGERDAYDDAGGPERWRPRRRAAEEYRERAGVYSVELNARGWRLDHIRRTLHPLLEELENHE
ncbi:MAG TPA: hypothetical protein RMF84_18855 [Polyangiaceae bacterium LLY-WYZ-14_1]|nr:hypothetical protein [Polyangiaceae bacterium LLY-WYZ-14_1]